MRLSRSAIAPSEQWFGYCHRTIVVLSSGLHAEKGVLTSRGAIAGVETTGHTLGFVL